MTAKPGDEREALEAAAEIMSTRGPNRVMEIQRARMWERESAWTRYERLLAEVLLAREQQKDAEIERLNLDVVSEIERQEGMWGKQTHSDEWWLAILTEEVGEAAQGVLQEHFGGQAEARKEVVQIAAVALSWLEWIDERAALASPESADEGSA